MMAVDRYMERGSLPVKYEREQYSESQKRKFAKAMKIDQQYPEYKRGNKIVRHESEV